MVGKEEVLAEMETEVIELFVRASQLIGLPRSVGEIYGILFISQEPMSMDEIIEKLQISLGSASQGLKQLRAFRAVRAVYVPGQRKDYYEAETEFRKLTAGFLKEEVYPHLERAGERLESIKLLIEGSSDGCTSHYLGRYDKLRSWHQMSAGLIRKVTSFIDF